MGKIYQPSWQTGPLLERPPLILSHAIGKSERLQEARCNQLGRLCTEHSLQQVDAVASDVRRETTTGICLRLS